MNIADGLRREDRDGVAILVFDRAEKRNAMTTSMLRGFIAELDRISDDDGVRAVVVTGDGGAFCAGADVSALRDSADARPGQQSEAINATEPDWWLVRCKKPTVAAIDGVAYGLGAELLCQADLRIATARAKIAWNFVHMGLVPDTGAATYLLPQIVGLPETINLLLDGRPITGDRALEIGLVTAVVEPDQLIEQAVAEALRLSSGSSFAIQRIKQLVYAAGGRSGAEHLEASTKALSECFGSDDYREGVDAFLARRPARFSGH